MPMIEPASTSLRKCMPRMMREAAIRIAAPISASSSGGRSLTGQVRLLGRN